MNAHLRDELIRFANVFGNNSQYDISSSNLDFSTKKVLEEITNNMHDVLVVFANEIAK